MAVPGLLVGGVILTAAVPIFKRTAQGISEERRLPVDFLDALAIVLLTAQGSFLVPAFVVGVIEGSEIVRDLTARRPPRTGLDLLLPGSATPWSSEPAGRSGSWAVSARATSCSSGAVTGSWSTARCWKARDWSTSTS